jgi:hypothetical protein
VLSETGIDAWDEQDSVLVQCLADMASGKIKNSDRYIYWYDQYCRVAKELKAERRDANKELNRMKAELSLMSEVIDSGKILEQCKDLLQKLKTHTKQRTQK